MLRHPDGSREPLAIGVPGDRDVDMKRLEAAVLPAEAEPFTEADFAGQPDARQGLHRAGARSARRRRRASASSSTRGSSTGRRGSPAPTRPASHVVRARRRARLHARRRDRRRRRRARRPVPELRLAARDRPRRRDRPHLPARPQVRRGARPHGARRRRQAGRRHDGLLRHRRLPRRGRDRRDDVRRARPVLAARTWPPPTSTS